MHVTLLSYSFLNRLSDVSALIIISRLFLYLSMLIRHLLNIASKKLNLKKAIVGKRDNRSLKNTSLIPHYKIYYRFLQPGQ